MRAVTCGRYNVYKAIANDLDIAERCQMANQKMEDAQELMSLVWPPSPGADVAGVSPVPAQRWRG